MRYKLRLWAALMTACCLCVFSGCSVKGKTVYFETPSGRNTVFKIGDMKCSKKEAMIYLLNEKNIYGTVDGVNLWSEGFNTDAITDSLKDATLEHLTKVYVLDLYAAEQEIELTEKEKEACEEAANEYFESLSTDEISFTGVKKKDIANMYEKYVLAEKVYAELMDSVDEEVSEDECRVMEAFVLFVTDEAEANEIQDMINTGFTFERLAATYTELDTYQVTFARNQYSKEVDDVVFNLDTEEVSGKIESDGGYYFFQCLDKYNEELSEENKTVIIEARRAQVINDIISDLEARYYSDMNEELWSKITIASEDADNLTSGSFFEVLSDHIKY